eukprot:COSAG06_NODE_23844_length_680_cov_0.641997_1_plen_226_part_11
MQIQVYWSGAEDGNYSVRFKSTFSGKYKVDVRAGHDEQHPNDLTRHEAAVEKRSVPHSAFPVLVRPADLDLNVSGPGPQFDEREAGRGSAFGVMPKDQYGDIRALLVFGLADELHVELEGKGSLCQFHSTPMTASYGTKRSKLTPNATLLSVDWNATRAGNDANWIPKDPIYSHGHGEPHFAVSFLVTVSGSYSLSVSISDQDDRHSMHPRQVAAPIHASPFALKV